MQITLNQDEIHAAVEAYVRGQISIAPNQSLSIEFGTTRNPTGINATLDIRAAAPAIASKPVTRAPAAAKAETPKADNAPSEPKPAISTTPEAREEPEEAPKANPFAKAASTSTEEAAPEEDQADEEGAAVEDPNETTDAAEAPTAPAGSIFSRRQAS